MTGMPEAGGRVSNAKDFDSQVESIAALGEPVRRALYQFVVEQGTPVSREQAAQGVGVAWHVAKFHLDRLEQDGLLDVEFKRPPGRTGPGAGRPTKLYRRAAREVAVHLPERRYDLAARIMADAISGSQTGGTPVSETLHNAAATVGRDLGKEAKRRAGPEAERESMLSAVMETLNACGYECRKAGSVVALANCPFHALAQDYTDLVCGMNLDLIAAMLESLGEDIEARLDPAPERCCVTLGSGSA